MSTKRYLRQPSEKMVGMLRDLFKGVEIHWMGGIDACAYYRGTLKNCTPTVLGLRERGFVEITVTATHRGSGYVAITQAGKTFLEGLK